MMEAAQAASIIYRNYSTYVSTPEFQRAFELLWADLTPKQRQEFVQCDSFCVNGSISGARIGRDGQCSVGCIAPDDHELPIPDRVLVMKKWIEADEQQVRRVANRPTMTLNAHFQAEDEERARLRAAARDAARVLEPGQEVMYIPIISPVDVDRDQPF